MCGEETAAVLIGFPTGRLAQSIASRPVGLGRDGRLGEPPTITEVRPVGRWVVGDGPVRPVIVEVAEALGEGEEGPPGDRIGALGAALCEPDDVRPSRCGSALNG